MQGKLILLVGVPGAGKSTLMQYARDAFPKIVFPKSWTTRPMRPGETEGVTYHFATDEEFAEAAKEGKFLEWVTIDSGRCYGTLKEDITSALAVGKYVLREVEPIGARNIRTLLPGQVVTIFITAGSWEEMSRRIQARAPIDAEELERRRERYEQELSFGAEADFTISNRDGELERAKEALTQTIRQITNSKL